MRKKQILNILSSAKIPYTAREITDLCYPISLSCISGLLKRYSLYGLIKRKRKNNKFQYIITEKGLKRLEFLLGSENIKPKIDLLVREKIRL